MGFIDTWKAVIQTPSDFYENMPKTGGYEEPLKFVVICYIPLAILTLFSGIITFDFSVLLLSPLMLLLGVIAVFIESFFVQIGVLIFAKENREGFEATVRVVSYASAVSLITNSITLIPIIGPLFSIPISLYGLYLGVVGIMKVHQTTGFRAVLTYLPLLLVIVVLLLVFILMVVLSITSTSQNTGPYY